MRVLVVDDDEDTGTLLSELLERHEFETRVVLHGKDAVSAAADADVVILDLVLRDMSGVEVLRRLKLDDRTRDVPVIVVTADGLLGGRQRALEHGAVAAFVKPVPVDVLAAAVRAARGVLQTG